MQGKPYHHGNLKNTLLEAGIEMINENGIENFSIRKLAKRCEVSSTAPYAHFQGKEEMIELMQEYITSSFMTRLKDASDHLVQQGNYEEALMEMGRAYVRYFLEHPSYFPFLFSRSCMKANISITNSADGDFAPYKMMRELIITWCSHLEPPMSDHEIEIRIIRMWSSVHGVAALTNMKGVVWNRDWEEEIRNIIN